MQRMPTIGSDLEYKRAPSLPDAEQLEGWVQAYRDGASGFQNLIVTAHLHLIMCIVGRFKRRHNYQDLEGTALLALTEAVVDAQTALEDNEITPYITTCVRFRLRDHIATDRLVAMPPRTFRYKAKRGEIKREGNIDAAIVGVVTTPVLARADTYLDSNDEIVRSVEGTAYSVPEARPEGPPLEFKEALNLAIHTEQERRVIDLRAQGLGYSDFETVMGLKKSRVGEIVNNVEARFNVLYA